jgi:hypothetical protein
VIEALEKMKRENRGRGTLGLFGEQEEESGRKWRLD